jgi:mannitol-1-/sugar-/sorbitol-6-phosphatase
MRIPAGTLISAKALLFDMDGTLVDSTVAVERIWGRWASQHGVDFARYIHRMHGRRAIDLMREMAPPHLDPEHEVKQIDRDELEETEGIVAVPGAPELLASLPRSAWALVTSARPPLARARMGAAGLDMPDLAVTSADVRNGKPHPECFQLAMRRIGCEPADAVVFEDAPAGFAAGKAAGCRVIALATTSTPEQLADQDWLPDLSCITLESIEADGTLKLRVS